jgi:hypothetical protein
MKKKASGLIGAEANRPFYTTPQAREKGTALVDEGRGVHSAVNAREKRLKAFYRILPAKLRPAYLKFMKDQNIIEFRDAMKGKRGPNGILLLKTFMEAFGG